jgi:hypothetical protein
MRVAEKITEITEMVVITRTRTRITTTSSSTTTTTTSPTTSTINNITRTKIAVIPVSTPTAAAAPVVPDSLVAPFGPFADRWCPILSISALLAPGADPKAEPIALVAPRSCDTVEARGPCQ